MSELLGVIIALLVLGALTGQITTDPENNWLLGNPLSILFGLMLGSGWYVLGLLVLNLLIWKGREHARTCK